MRVEADNAFDVLLYIHHWLSQCPFLSPSSLHPPSSQPIAATEEQTMLVGQGKRN